MKQIQTAIAGALAFAMGALIIFGGAWFGVLAIIRSMEPEALATLMVSTTCAAAGSALAVIALVLALGRERSGEARAVRDYNRGLDHAQVIDSQWRQVEPGNWRPPVPVQLRAPLITVPVVRNMGKPASITPPPPVLESNTAEGEAIQIPIDAAIKFAQLDTPTRTEWRGDRGMYGQCAKWFAAHGILSRTQNGGYTWAPQYDEATRVDWLQQFEA